MKKTKIAFCLRDMRIGGVEAVCIRMMDALLATGRYEIVFISYTKITTPVYAEWFANHPDVKTYALYPARGMGTNLPHFFLWRIIRHLMRDVYRGVRRMTMNTRRFADVDLFIDFYNFSFAREFKKFKTPKITWWHLSIKKFLARDRSRALDSYDAMVALTDGFVADTSAAYPAYAHKIRRIYNPIDVDAVRTRAELAPCGGDYFACVGRLDGDKDTSTVIRAFDRFWNNAGRPDMDLVIVGD